MRWARVIARFEVLKFRRKMARDRHVFTDELIDLLAASTKKQTEADLDERYRGALEECLETLPQNSRQLIGAAYRGDRSIREVAEDLGRTAPALYKTLDRLRKRLRDCIETRLALGESAG